MRNYDDFEKAIHKDRARNALTAVFGCVLFIAVGVFFYGFIYAVEYRRVPVVEVLQFPGRDASVRIVIVDLGDQTYPLRTSDRLIWVRPGDQACIAERGLIGRKRLKYRLALPIYCRRSRGA